MSFTLTSVTYAYRRAAAPVLRNLSLQIPGGTTTAILGPSGAGKSTLLNLLGLLWEGQLASGTITYQPEGEPPRDYSRLNDAERAHLRREAFGFIPQNSYLLPGFTCAQNILLPLLLQGHSRQECRQRLDDFLARDEFRDLRDVLSSFAGEVAGGQRQRAAVLRAVIHDPRVILADEPVSNLDPENTRVFLDLLQRWQSGGLAHPSPPLAPGLPGVESVPRASPGLKEESGVREKRTLLLVCHDAETAWRVGEQFLFLRGLGAEGTGSTFLRRDELTGVAEVRQRISVDCTRV